MNDLPPIFFADHPKINGAANFIVPENPREAAPMLARSPFLEAFKTRHKTDAHFVTYHMLEPDGTIGEMPRLKKVAEYAVSDAGGKVVTHSLVLDYDTPGHVFLTPELLVEMMAKLMSFPLGMAWTLAYTTRAGMRLVYVLANPIPVSETEGRIRGLIAKFHAAGVMVDELVDWTRLFRFPYVIRENKPTWAPAPKDPVPEFMEQLGNRLDASTLPMLAGPSGNPLTVSPKPFTDPQPSRTEAELLLRGENHTKHSEFYKFAKRQLQNRECFPCLFENKPIASRGARDMTIMSYVGQAISMTYRNPTTTPEGIYALFLPSVEQLQPDTDTPDWTVKLWDIVGRIWSQEDAKEEEREAREAARIRDQRTTVEKLAEAVQRWPVPPHKDLLNPDTARQYVNRHLIASTGGSAGLYLMEATGEGKGFYRKYPVTSANLIASIRNSELAKVIETTTPALRGEATDKSPAQIVNTHATIVREVWMEPGDGVGGYIDHIDEAGAALRVRAFCRNPDLEPEYSPMVDEWLRLFFGEHYDQGIRWIAYSLAFEEGAICALSVKGPPGIGKKMLYQGLSECLKYPALATGKDLVGDFNDGLLHSPFLVVNEGWPTGGKGMHPADQFRSLVSGDPIVVNQKFMAPIRVTCGVRVMFLANNEEVVQMLSHKRDLSPHDREALAVRLLHLDVDDAAARWLKQNGGVDLTGRNGARWIRGDGGAASDFIVAKHFLWLHARRQELGKPGTRFLVEGNASKDILFDLRTATGRAPLVIESLIGMLEAPSSSFPGLTVESTPTDDHGVLPPRLFVLPVDIMNYYRANIREKNGGMSLELGHINKSLSGLVVDSGAPTRAFMLPTRREMGPKWWWEIDTFALLKVAQKDGYKCPKLQAIVDKQTPATGVPHAGK